MSTDIAVREVWVIESGDGKPLSVDVDRAAMIGLETANRVQGDRIRRYVPAAEWIPILKPNGYLAVDEGETYLFAIQASLNEAPHEWEYFSDRVIWDAETEPQWGDGGHGWDLNDEIWFRVRPEPPVIP